jgi:hypothetical protein
MIAESIAGNSHSDWQSDELVFIESEVHILPTHMTPEYILNNEGFIKISGRGLYCERPAFADQIVSWIDDYLTNPARITHVTIAFEYLNSISTSVLVTIFRKLYQILRESKTLVVQWYYEPDDENILDRGKYVSSCSDIPIEFIMTSNVACL